MKALLLMVLSLGVLSACGFETVTSPDLVSSYKAPTTPGPSPCLYPGHLPSIDAPKPGAEKPWSLAPSPDPVTGLCPPPWTNQ